LLILQGQGNERHANGDNDQHCAFHDALVQPVYGMLADSKGYKKTFVFSALAATVSYALYLPGNSFAYLFAVTVMMAVFYNALLPLLDSLSLKLVQADPKFSYGTLRIAGAAGWAFTGILTGQLIDAINTRVIFVVAAVSMLLVFIVAMFLEPDDDSVKEAGQHSLKTARSLLVDKRLVFFLTGVFLISVGTSTIWYFYSIYMKENGASASLVGFGLSFRDFASYRCFIFLRGSLRDWALRLRYC
jgi:PPP family 3-phenylpropionic acid transporter